MLIVTGFFEHQEILVMNNARIHTAGEAECVEYYLWNTVIDGKPLHLKIVFFPTPCPELNPIEFMFHFELSARSIARWLKSWDKSWMK